MKVCSYCGHQNEDLASACSGCGTANFRDESSARPTTGWAFLRELYQRWFPQPPAPTPPCGTEALPYSPEEHWGSLDAWKCIGMCVVFEIILTGLWMGVEMKSRVFTHWSASGAGHLVRACAYNSAFLLTTLYFARTETLASFRKAFGLRQRPSSAAWFGVVMVLGIRVVTHFLISWGWSKGATTSSLRGFGHTHGIESALFLIPALVIAPLCEELYMRGFLYRAFRGSYSVRTSMLLILALTAVTHWNQVGRSWAAALGIGAVTLCQCYLRERTGNLWDCILCHLVFNATGAASRVVFH